MQVNSNVRRRMPAISVLLDGEPLVTVSTIGYDVVSVHVHGTRTDAEFATLDVSGGAYPATGEPMHLIWISSHELRPDQLIEVRFEEAGETSHRGKTIEELFPEEQAAEEPVDFKPTEAMFAELRGKPLLRNGYSFRLRGSIGEPFAGTTAPADHGFAFNLVWNSHRPQRASHSLHAYTLDELEKRSPLRDFIREYIEVPYAIALQIAA
jgi:hypothetical protein